MESHDVIKETFQKIAIVSIFPTVLFYLMAVVSVVCGYNNKISKMLQGTLGKKGWLVLCGMLSVVSFVAFFTCVMAENIWFEVTKGTSHLSQKHIIAMFCVAMGSFLWCIQVSIHGWIFAEEADDFYTEETTWKPRTTVYFIGLRLLGFVIMCGAAVLSENVPWYLAYITLPYVVFQFLVWDVLLLRYTCTAT